MTSRFQSPCFRSLVPPLTETFAFRNASPCRLEQASHFAVPVPGLSSDDDVLQHVESQPCPFHVVCSRTAYGLTVLERAFGPNTQVTLTETSSSIVVRSEHQYNLDERHRLSIRKHFYEAIPQEFDANGELLPLWIDREAAESVIGSLEVMRDQRKLLVQVDPLRAFFETRFRRARHSSDASGKEAFPVFDADEFSRKLIEWLKKTGPANASSAEAITHYTVRSLMTRFGCHRLRTGTEFNKYLGFIDLRMHSVTAPIAMAVLAVPRHLRHAENVYVITGTYGPIFGGPGFSSTVYSMQDPQGGGKCAQACTIMALAMLADRGPKVMGSFNVTYLSSLVGEPEAVHPEQASPQHCLKRDRNDNGRIFNVGGLTFEQLEALLNRPECGTTVSAERLGVSERRLTARLLECYTTARCPTIVLLQDQRWYPWADTSVEPVGHAVVVVGFRKRGHDDVSLDAGSPPLIDSVIVHDPGHSPYVERGISQLFDASRGFEHREGASLSVKDRFHSLFVAPKTIQTHLFRCLRELCFCSEDVRDEGYWRFFSGCWPRFSSGADLPAGADYHFAHVHRADVGRYLFDSAMNPNDRQTWQSNGFASDQNVADARKDIDEATGTVAGSWCWVVRCFWRKQLAVAWVFEANVDVRYQLREHDGRRVPWAVRILRCRRVESGKVVQASTLEVGPEPATDPRRLSPTPVTFTTERKVAKGRRQMHASVITSASDRRLPDLLNEICQISHVCDFDIYLLRNNDMADIDALWKPRGKHLKPQFSAESHSLDTRSPTDILAKKKNLKLIYKWLRHCLHATNAEIALSKGASGRRVRIAALATYFPDISSRSDKRRRKSIDALTNSILLALQLTRTPIAAGESESAMMKHAIVEIVCGTRLDKCDCSKACRGSHIVYESQVETKLELLKDSLCQVAKNINGKQQRRDWYLALELEPGSTYLLRDSQSLLQTLESLLSSRLLRGHVGINVDIAHMKIANVDPESILGREHVLNRILHAHTSDHPTGMHTRDQAIGRWSTIERYNGPDYRYLRVLQERADMKDTLLPFSRRVALELEGCNRMRSVHDSLSALRGLLTAAKTRGY